MAAKKQKISQLKLLSLYHKQGAVLCTTNCYKKILVDTGAFGNGIINFTLDSSIY